jgi:hypothetical protein
MTTTSHHLFPTNHSAACNAGHRCTQAVVEHNGRWWITFGHCGFNGALNNGRGYATEAAARKGILRHQRPAFTAQIEAAVAK